MIFNPKNISESLIQCELYRRCFEEGIDVYPEYSCEVNGRRCRFDLVIILDEEIIMIIEVKSRSSNYKIHRGKQYEKYKQTGLPVIYCTNLEMIENTMNRIRVNLARRKQINNRKWKL